MIVVSIAALQILGIASISEPASAMLTAVFTAIPNIIAAVALVGIGVLIARFVSGLFRPLLESSGVDSWLTKQEILPQGSSVVPTVLRVVEIAVVLFFAVMGAQVLGFPQITSFLSEILALGGNVLFGGAIIAAGFFLAAIIGKILSGTVSTVVRWAIIILFTAMGLQSMVAGQGLMLAWMRMWWTPWTASTWNGNALASQAAQWQNAMWGVVGKGLAPVHSKAVANARRLARG
jgi:hypothetical protein